MKLYAEQRLHQWRDDLFAPEAPSEAVHREQRLPQPRDV